MQNILVIGGNSAIALAYLKRIISDNKEINILLVSQSEAKLNFNKDDLVTRGAKVETITSDLLNCSCFDSILEKMPLIDQAIIAHGSLVDNYLIKKNSNYLQNQININFNSYLIWSEAILDTFQKQNKGQLILLGSVAGDRIRKSNYIYGALKGALEKYSEGLQHKFSNNHNIHILLVKPGLIDTPMTEAFSKKSFIWSKTSVVANDINKAVLKKKQKVYTPNFWKYIMLIIMYMPRFIFNRVDF